jgi:hypothetical protein
MDDSGPDIVVLVGCALLGTFVALVFVNLPVVMMTTAQ